MRWLCTLSLMLLALAVVAQQPADTHRLELTGRVLQADSVTAVPFAHVIRLSSGLGIVADSGGWFSIDIGPYDTLQVSAIGFMPQTIDPTELAKRAETLMIQLQQDTAQLKTHTVFRFSNKGDFKNEFANMPIEEEEDSLKINLRGVTQYNGPIVIPRAGIGSPVSLIHNVFGKEARMKRKMNRYRKWRDAGKGASESIR